MSNSKKNIFKTTNFTCLKGLFDDPLNRILSKISLFSHLLDSTGPTIICALNGGFDWSADWLILVFEGKQNMSNMCKSGYDYALFWGWKICVGIFWAPEHVHHLPDQVNHLPNNPYLTYTNVSTATNSGPWKIMIITSNKVLSYQEGENWYDWHVDPHCSKTWVRKVKGRTMAIFKKEDALTMTRSPFFHVVKRAKVSRWPE